MERDVQGEQVAMRSLQIFYQPCSTKISNIHLFIFQSTHLGGSTKKEASRWRECVNTTKYFYKFHYCPNMAGKKDTDSNLEIK